MGSHNIAFLIDTAAASEVGLLRQAALRVLLHSARGSGFHNVRWAFKLFDSAAARPRARGGSRGHGFRELRLRQLEELEEALSREPGSAAPTAAATQTALIEALSDYEWDRPDITSPAKCRRGSAAEAPQPRLRSSLFLFAPCPHSRAHLLGFLQLPASHSGQQLAERIIPPPVRALLSSHCIALHWVDTQPLQQFIEAPDHFGYKMVSEVMRFVGGSLIPFAGLMQLSLNGITVLSDKTSQVGLRKIVFEKNGTDAKEYLKLRKTVSALFPLDCSMNYMMNLEAFYQKMFPLQQGLLTITQGEQEICCPVALEPISCSQKYLTAPVRIIVKGAVKDWDLQRTGQLSTHAWILQRAKQKDIKETYFLHQLLKEIIYNNINVVVEVEANNYLPPSTGILSPLLSGTAMLTLISWEQEPEFEELFLQTELTESSQVMASEVLDIVSKALNLFSDITECQTCSEVTVPDWAQAELAETSQQRASFGEGWFPLSELSGASSTLMESIGSMSGEDEKVNMDSEVVLSGHLAEFYQRKSADEAGAVIEHGVKKRQCGPRTPIRQKMRSMSRSLQMLNVARLNLKAQKSQPDGVQLPIGDESTHQPKKSLGGKQKTRRMRKSTVDFKSDEEMVSSLKENYQKHVADDELSQFSFIQNAVKVIKMHLKSSNTEAFEATCINLIQMQLLKSSKSIRQQYGNQENKELKVRDCQLQVLLHLEMFQQFPTLQSDPEQLELLVEEMTNLLRIISLTKDTTFLAKFLEEEILNMYLLSIPKILGELYFGLGQNVPARLASVLPADFLSDESMSQKTESPDAPQLTLLATSTSFADCEGEQLEELRTRSSRKRRNLPLMRHRSMSEVSHNLRQIQIPKKSMKLQENIQSHAPIATEQAVLPPQPSQKEAQEVTKVRRNLFNRENSSPRKKSKMPKSYSESVVEGVRHLHGEQKANKGHRKLLTRKVTETPLHKQVSHRLLDKQIRGRCSETDSDVSIVKESPERARFTDLNLHTRKLRRSPRIRNVSLARTHSSSFYSGSCSVSRSLERVQSMSHIQAGKAKRTGNQIIRSPNRLLFGAVRGLVSPKEKRSSKASCLDSDCLSAVQSPKPTPDNSPSSPNKDRAAQKSPQTSRYLTPGKKARSSKSPTTRNPINDYLIKESSPWKMTTNSQFQSPRRSERLNKGVANKSILAPKMEVQSSFRSPLMVSGHLLLSSPDTDNLSVKPSPRRSECLSSPCRNSSTVNIPSNTVESASQVKSSRKGLSVLNSPVRISEKLLPSYSINNLAKDKSSTSCAPRNMKLRKSKSDESFISRTPKICTCRSLKRNADTSCSSDQSKSQKSSASAACTLTSIWKVSFQTPQQTSVMTRSMHSVSAPDRLCAMRYKSPERDGLHVTTSKFEMQTPPKHNSTPLKNPVRTRSMFNVTPMQSGLKTPSKYTSPPPKCPVRTRSMFATPLKSELKTPSKFTATSPKSPVRTRSMFIVTPSKIEMTDTSTRIGTCLNVAHSKVDQKLLSKCNSTPLKSPVMTRSQSTLSSTPPYLKTPPRTMSELNITSKREESTVSKSRPLLRAAPRSVTRNEPDVESMKMPGNCATSKMQLDRMLKTPEKSKSTICNLQKKFPKSHRAFSTSNLEEERALQEPNLQMSIPQIKIEVPDTRARFVTDQNISLSWSAATYDNLGNLGEDCFNAVVGLSASDSLSRSSQSTVSNVDLIAEKLDSSLTSAADSGVANAQAEESSDISQVRLIQSESSGLKMKFAVLRRESDSSVSNSVDAAKFPSIPNKSTTYEFRWTPDRRQRLAAAQQQIPEFPKKISTPKGRNWPPMPTYEVELEMQDSGLPKLRFKRTNSSMVVSPPLEHSVIKISDNPCVCVKKRGCESPLGKRNAQRCVKHSGKTEGGPISPSFCFHSSHNTPAKATPRKGGVQTYICQSYTPTQYSSNTSSPSQPDLGLVPWTPSPTHKIRPSQTPDTIKNWPRKKKAATTPLGGKWQKGYPATMQKEDNFYTEHYSNKAVSLEEIGMEGVSRLQDHSPTIEWDRRFPASPEEKFGLRSRKRGCSFISPTSEDEKAAQKRRKSNFIAPFSETEFAQKEVQKEKSPSGSFSPCKIFTWRSFEDDVVFDCPAVASPSCKVKSTLSASGLLALTQSPLLYAGTTPKKRPGTRDIMYEDMQTDSSASKRKAIVGEIDQDCSPFTKAPVRRCITKTYSRKKLVS